MPSENVEIVRRVYEAAASQDAAAVYELYDADVELDSTRVDVQDASYRGHEGLKRFFREWHEAWESIEYDYDELIDAGDDQVIAVVTRRARGRSSGADVEWRVALTWTIRAGKIVRVVWFPSREAALEAAEAGS